jgi:hypothetical protein
VIDYLTTWSRILLEKLMPVQLVKNLLQDSALRQMNLLQNLTPYFFNIHCNGNFPSMLRSPKWPLSSKFSAKNIVCIYHQPHLILLESLTLILFGEEYKLWRSSLCSFFHPVTFFFRFTYSFQHPVLTHPRSAISPLVERPSYTHTKHTKL